MKKHILAPLVAIVGGVVGCALRVWGLVAGFEADTGLPISGAPSTWALILLSVAMVVALFLLVRRIPAAPASIQYGQAFYAEGNMPYMICTVLAAFALLVAGVWMALAFLRGSNPSIIRLILAVLCFLSAFCVLSAGKNNYRGEVGGKYSAVLLMPAYTCCLWLIAAYQVRAGDPVQLDYIYELFAIIAALLGLYYTAGFSFDRPKPRRAVFFSLLGAYFSIVTMADRHDLAFVLLYCFTILAPLASATVLMKNLHGPLPPVPAPDPEFETDEEDLNDEP